jgi:hypothetical protein
LQHRGIADQLAKFGSQKARARFTWTGIAQQLLSLLGQSALQRCSDARRLLADGDAAVIEEDLWKAEACL